MRPIFFFEIPNEAIRAVRTACLLLDNVQIHTTPMEGIAGFRSQLERGEMMPVGSVEFVSEAMSVAGVDLPTAPGFPAAMQPWLHRTIARTTVTKLADVRARTFVKPVETKLFNGFVYDPQVPLQAMAEHDREQRIVLAGLDGDTEIWTSTVVEFVSEWRYYVLNGRICGHARYDPDGAEDAPAPDRQQVELAIAAYDSVAPFAIDMGVLASGETTLVEIHDAWAIGLYNHALNPRDYYRFLRSYWDRLIAGRTAHA